MLDLRFMVSLIAAIAAAAASSYYVGDELLAIVVFQVALLMLLLTLDFDWKRLVAFELVQSTLAARVDEQVIVSIPPASHDATRHTVQVPSAILLTDPRVQRFAELQRSVTETRKFGAALDDQFRKMFFVAMGGGATVLLLRYVEKKLLVASGSAIGADLSLLLSIVKVLATIVPIALQLALVWGACLYLRKRNIELTF